ncbi:MAG: ATP-binding protein [Campylobacterales bacterium]|nr:ATP-binding protein [Campylobacterales bacterium]
MRLTVIFFTLLTTLFALSDNYKIVIETHKTKSKAQYVYEHEIANPDMPLFTYTKEKNLIVHVRKSGKTQIIAIEPFSNHNDAQIILDNIAPFYPNAFISRGVADDIELLLIKHRKDFSAINQQLTVSKAPQPIFTPPKKTTVSQTSRPRYEKWLILSILAAFIGYLVWRERVLKALKNRNQLLSREKEEIQNVMQAKNEFIAMMNHDIRAPINAIMGINHLLLESDLTLRQRSQLTKIKDASTILLTLVNDILDHSKIEAGKIIIEKIPFNLNTVLDNISNIISQKANEKNLALIFDIDKSVPNKLIGDPLRLFQIMVNLLNNAIKFTDTGNVILRLRAEQITSLDVKIHFAIIDTGIGIKPESLKQLFTPYVQADATITRKYGGTGLGLIICKNLISLMGGSIHVESTPNQGSTFSFELHFYSDSAYEKRRYRLPTTDLMSKNGLILETNLISAEVLKRGLEYFHYEVKIVTNPADALAVLKNHFLDILFIDTNMILSGEFKKELQNRVKNEDLKLVWMGDDFKRRGGIILAKPYNQLRIFNTILLAYGHLDQEKQVQNNGQKFKEKLKQFSGETLLLAEDNEINCSIVKGLLAGTNITVITASNGKEAIEMVEQNSTIKVILMDIQMPIMDGFEATKWIRQDPKKDFISIIAVTGNTFEKDIHKISHSGMDGHIGKPLDVNTFYTTLYYAFEESRNKSKKRAD